MCEGREGTRWGEKCKLTCNGSLGELVLASIKLLEKATGEYDPEIYIVS